jgi:hypothetical protein
MILIKNRPYSFQFPKYLLNISMGQCIIKASVLILCLFGFNETHWTLFAVVLCEVFGTFTIL